MKTVKTAIQYCVEVTRDEFLNIMDADAYYENLNYFDTPLCMELDALDNIQDVDYNGHFGPNIFFPLELTDTKDIDLAKAQVIIKKWIELKPAKNA